VKVIIDTNVLVSGIFFGGIPGEILKAWRKGLFEMVISHDIYEEYQEVVKELQKKYSKDHATDEIVKTILLNSEMTLSVLLKESICEDPDDDKFISAALASKVKIIVSGDKLLNKVSGRFGITVLTPKRFFEEYIQDKK
jgi:putative PIN family toxin of toxin-antitoxin system